MKTGIKVAIGLALAGVAAYAAWPLIGQMGKKKESEVPEIPEDTKDTAMELILAKNVQTQESLPEKVKRLQKLIGVTVDGIAGKQTMTRLNKFLKVEKLTNYNIDGINKVLSYVAPAVASMASHLKDSPQGKAKIWNYWVETVKKGNITFDPYVTRAYFNITGRSIYKDFANRVQDTSKTFTVRNPKSMYGMGNTNLI